MTVEQGVIAAAIVLNVVMWLYLALGQRELRQHLGRHRRKLSDHHRAIVHLQGTSADTGTTSRRPMPTVGNLRRSVVHRPPSVLPVPAPAPELSDIERALADAGRGLTATELATRLGRQTWDLLPDIDRDMAAGRIRTVPGHTAGRTAYALTDGDTLRMARMPVLPGTVAR